MTYPQTVTELYEQHPHYVFYCAACHDAYDPEEVNGLYREHGDFVASCPHCAELLSAGDHLQVCPDELNEEV